MQSISIDKFFRKNKDARFKHLQAQLRLQERFLQIVN